MTTRRTPVIIEVKLLRPTSKKDSRAMFTAAANHIASLVATAASQFTGIDWASGPQQLLTMIRRGRGAACDPAELESELAGVYWGADGSHESQSLRLRWGRLISAAARGAATEVDAQELVDAEAAAVKAAADSAAEQGQLAVEAVRVGDWGAAIAAAATAARLEREYGDAPAWGGLESEIRALPEYQAVQAAVAEYQADVRDEAVIRAEVDAVAEGRQVCESLECAVNADPRVVADDAAWHARYVAAWVCEMREWAA